MQAAIEVVNVDHFFGSGQLRKQVLHGISATIAPGEIVIVTGPSGSGKTTLLTLAGALRSVQHGSLRVLGQQLNGAGLRTLVGIREELGFIFQAHNLLNALTAKQNVQVALGTDNTVLRQEAEKKATYMLHAVGLGDVLDYRPEQLSGGQRQRLAIARALVRRPKIILADEPTASLDRTSGHEIVDLLHQLAKVQGCSVLLVTHDHRILDIADRVLLLEDGHLSAFGSGLVAQTGHMLSAFAQLQNRAQIVEHLLSLPWHKFLPTLEQVTTELQHLLKVMDLVEDDAVDAIVDRILHAITEKVRELLQCETAIVFLLDRENSVLRSRIVLGGTAEALTAALTRGIAGRVAILDQLMNVAEPYRHPDFDASSDLQTGRRTRNLLCMPIHDRNRSVLAVLEFSNKKAGNTFEGSDEQRLREMEDAFGAVLEASGRLNRQPCARIARPAGPSA